MPVPVVPPEPDDPVVAPEPVAVDPAPPVSAPVPPVRADTRCAGASGCAAGARSAAGPAGAGVSAGACGSGHGLAAADVAGHRGAGEGSWAGVAAVAAAAGDAAGGRGVTDAARGGGAAVGVGRATAGPAGEAATTGDVGAAGAGVRGRALDAGPQVGRADERRGAVAVGQALNAVVRALHHFAATGGCRTVGVASASRRRRTVAEPRGHPDAGLAARTTVSVRTASRHAEPAGAAADETRGGASAGGVRRAAAQARLRDALGTKPAAATGVAGRALGTGTPEGARLLAGRACRVGAIRWPVAGAGDAAVRGGRADGRGAAAVGIGETADAAASAVGGVAKRGGGAAAAGVGGRAGGAGARRQADRGRPAALPTAEARAAGPAGEVADRVVPAQSAFALQPTQVPLGASQTWPVAAQAPGFPAAQDAQRPSPVQTGVGLAHSASAVQLRQVCVPASQTGVAPLQSAAAMQVTHVPLVFSQSGVDPVQAARLVAEQTPQLPPGWQAGAPALHSPSTTQLRQPPVTASHTGVVPLQLALDVQPTQVPVDDWHCGVAPPQAAMLVAEQAPQVPFGWQAGVDPPQSPSRVQPRQVFVVVSQIGLVPPHCEALVQETQVPVAPSQPATGPLHFPVLVEEQTPQTPLGWQAGVDPPQSTSDAQPRQACVAGSHTGVDPLHPALVRQPTQVPLVASQRLVDPMQRRALLAEQALQAPFGWQAGVAPPQSASDAQPRQVRLVRSQTGVTPPQPVLSIQATHVPPPRRRWRSFPCSGGDCWPSTGRTRRCRLRPRSPPQSPSEAQVRQLCVVASHTGLPAGQSDAVTQPTQVPLPALQIGVDAAHWDALLAEHCAQAPLAWQAGATPRTRRRRCNRGRCASRDPADRLRAAAVGGSEAAHAGSRHRVADRGGARARRHLLGRAFAASTTRLTSRRRPAAVGVAGTDAAGVRGQVRRPGWPRCNRSSPRRSRSGRSRRRRPGWPRCTGSCWKGSRFRRRRSADRPGWPRHNRRRWRRRGRCAWRRCRWACHRCSRH